MIPDGALPGFLAADEMPPGTPETATTVGCGKATLAYWGMNSVAEGSPVLALSRIVRNTSGTIPMPDLVRDIRTRPEALMALLPPFAAAAGDADGVRMVADSMGFRQLYHTQADTPGPAAMSTTALGIAGVRNCALDETGVAVQSLLGWQLGQRTLLAGVSKLTPGSVASLSGEGIRLTGADPDDPAEQEEQDPAQAVRAAAALLRESLAALLDDHPDAVLQLTGGQDSRILLSAIPVARRKGLRAMTLGVPSSGDAEMAGRIAERYGLDHTVRGLASLQDLSPERAWDLTRSAAVRLDAMSDPIALAALAVGESGFEQGVRISGLGGEIARGFYYVGRVKDRPYTRQAAEQLASWRMFVNEAVEPGLSAPEFTAWAREAANAEVYTGLLQGGPEWFRATDHLYLRHRMQRWAGVTDTAVAYQRVVINPMLDAGFLEIASRLAPRDKAHSRFLARLQMELDPELGRLPLEGRPAPVSYAQSSIGGTIHHTYRTARGLARKLAQRVSRTNRPPAGGELLADKVVSWWRQEPQALAPVLKLGFVREQWVAEVLAGGIDPRPSSVAFLTNLVVASSASASKPISSTAQ